MRLKGAVFVVVVICLLVSPAQAKYGGGTGEPNNPYLISTPNDLNSIGLDPNDWSSHFLLTNDINLADYTGTQFNIIGNYSNRFTGVFDGNDHTISNFTYDSNGIDYIGIFGYVADQNAEIKNLGLIDPNVDGGTGDCVGSLVGVLRLGGAITNCFVEDGSVSGYGYVGGLAGYGGRITNCSSRGNVTGVEKIGGLVGGNGGVISNCSSTGSVSGKQRVGGLVGDNFESIDISNCYSSATVTGDNDVGGLVGSSSTAWGNTIIRNCYATGNVTATGQSVGGLIGYNTSSSTVSNSYATGSVSGDKDVGGLVGSNTDGTVSNSYAAGDVNGVINVGGLVGASSGHVVSCFWDVNSSGQTSSAGGAGKTTAQMKDPNTFIGWWCGGAWTIDAGVDYPRLWWENAPGELITNPGGWYGGGSGEANDPYLIYTAEQLNTISLIVCDLDKHFKLMVDIDLGGYTGTSFNIIGNRGTPFSGVFDGNDHTIFNFTYSSTGTNYIGIFGFVDGVSAEIKNLGLRDPNIDAETGSYVGSLVGYIGNGTITDCNLVGGSISGIGYYVGGMVGWNYSGTVSNSYSAGDVNGNSYVGGIVGANGGAVTDCYTTGNVSGNSRVGGLVGHNDYGTVSNSYAAGSVSGTGYYVGGLVGWNRGPISTCYATGSISGNDYVGGLVGYHVSGTVSNSSATGSVSGSGDRVGGLVGWNDSGTVSNSSATGSVSGSGNRVGGLVGWNDSGMVSNSYAAGSVSGDSDVGGLVGGNNGTVTDSFWDVNSSGLEISDGGTPKTTAEMQTKSTFTDAGWDFIGETDNGVQDIWRLCNEGAEYPQLNWQFLLGDFVCPDGVNFVDFAILGSAWLSEPDDVHWNSVCDISESNDNVIDTLDLDVFVENWLAGI